MRMVERIDDLLFADSVGAAFPRCSEELKLYTDSMRAHILLNIAEGGM
jgi:hypothetical protein